MEAVIIKPLINGPRTTKKTARAAATLTLVLLAAISAGAQITNVDDATSTPVPGVGHDYIHLLSETVNPANGSVSLRLGFPVSKGRGITPTFAMTYDSNQIHHLVPSTNSGAGFEEWQPANSYIGNYSWGFSLPRIESASATFDGGNYPYQFTCTGNTNYVFTDAGGSTHAMGMATLSQGQGNCPPTGSCSCSTTGQGPSAGGGDPQTVAEIGNGSPQARWPIYVYTTDGTVYTFSGLATSGYSSGLQSKIEDRNGNIITVNDNSTGTLFDSFSVQDTAGRNVISSNGMASGALSQTVEVGGLSYGITWTKVTDNAPIPSTWVGSTDGPQSQYGYCTAIPSILDTQSTTPVYEISQIQLPNGQSYHFQYGTDNSLPTSVFQNPYGLLNEIVYPSGAWVAYQWNTADTNNELAVFSAVEEGGGIVPNWCLFQYSSPVVTEREVGFSSAGSAQQTQNFAYTTTWAGAASGNVGGTAWTQKTTRVVTTDDVRGVAATTAYTYSPLTISNNDPLDFDDYPPQVSLESKVVYDDFAPPSSQPGNLLQTVKKGWYNQYQLETVQTIPASGSASETNYCYANVSGCPGYPSSFDLMTREDDYDYGITSWMPPTPQTGPLTVPPAPTIATRVMSTTYQQFTGAPGYLVDRACSIVTCSGGSTCSSSSTNRVAETDLLYDGGTAACGTAGAALTSSISGPALPPNTHDETQFASTKNTPRGNVTSIIKDCIYNGTACPNPTTTYAYDETGQITQSNDPNGNLTTFSYKDSPTGANPAGNSNAYLTSVSYADGSSDSYQYNYVDDNLTQSTDQNSNVTTYSYNDSLNRLTESQGPADPNNQNQHPTKMHCYDDSALSVTTTTLLSPTSSNSPPPPCPTSGPWKINVQIMDGVGHTTETELTSDPYGTDYQITTYDGVGKVYTATNPYRSTSDPTYGVMTYTYDALGRTRTKTDPDNSSYVQNWVYGATSSATTVTFTDENGNQWERFSDGLGRLKEVLEPNGASTSPTMPTTYTYDALNNLLSVNQTGTGSLPARQRSFTYDSLARLMSARNAESGLTTYSYLASPTVICSGDESSVCTKTDARSVKTTYAYDNMNRLIGKSYSDSVTPSSCYSFGGSSSTGFVGRLVAQWTQLPPAACPTTIPTSGFLTKRSISGYDSMGREMSELQYTPYSVGSGSSYPMAYSYDLAGDLTSSTAGGAPQGMQLSAPANPCSNSATFSAATFMFINCYDNAGRLQSVTSNAGTTAQPLFSEQGYAAFGGVTNATYGSNAVTLTRAFDPRLRIKSENDLGNAPSSQTSGAATLTITGTEQSQ